MTELGLKSNFLPLIIFTFRCMNALALSLTPSICYNKPFLIKGFRVSHSGGGGEGVCPPIQQFFSTPPMGWDNPPPIKNTPPLPSEKHPPQMKHEVSFHEMIPRKSTININLKSSYNPSKIWVKKFILSKFAGLQAYSQQLFYKMNSTTGIFQQNFKPPMLPPCIGAALPPCSQHLWEILGLLWRGEGGP